MTNYLVASTSIISIIALNNDEVKTVNNFALKYSNVRREFVNGFTITN